MLELLHKLAHLRGQRFRHLYFECHDVVPALVMVRRQLRHTRPVYSELVVVLSAWPNCQYFVSHECWYFDVTAQNSLTY